MPTDEQIRTYLHEEVQPTIARHGWMIQYVFPTDNQPDQFRPPFAYTIGLTAGGLPELVISGLPPEVSAELLNSAARKQSGDGYPDGFTAGTIVTGIASVDFHVIDAPAAEVNLARSMYGQARAVQLVWPDAGGAYPDDPAWSLSRDAQPTYREA